MSARDRVDPIRVAAHLERAPTDFGDFARAIRRWLDALAPANG